MWTGWLIYWLIAALSANRAKFIDPPNRRFWYGFLMVAAFFLIFHDRYWSGGRIYKYPPVRWAGVVITAIGVLFSIWARVHLGKYWSGIITLKEGHKLITTGPYRIVRHPIYTGMITGVIGSAITAGTGDAALGIVLFIWACMIKVRREEQLLTGEFGQEYEDFRRRVPMLVPFLVRPV
jgi:protein-S-isoprenylcysteine O-methyltransferase Ste14